MPPYSQRSKLSSYSADRRCDQLRDEQHKRNQLAAQSFIETTLGSSLESNNLHKELQDGILLCELMNRISPGAVRSVSRKNLPFVKMQNIGLFLQAAHQLGLQSSELFQTVDLYEAKDMMAVTNTILTLARLNAKHSPSVDHPSPKPGLLSTELLAKQTSVRHRRATDVRKVFNVEPTILSEKADSLRATLQLTIPATAKKASSDSGYSTLNRPPSMIFCLQDPPASKANLTKQQSSPLLSVPVGQTESPDDLPNPAPSRSTPMSSLPRPHLKRKTSQSIETRPSRSTSLAHSASTRKRDNIKVMLRKDDGSVEAHYQLGNSIGKGQFGTVYRALDMQTGEIVAIKRIKVENVDMDNDIMLEVELLKSMASSSIVRYIGFVRDEEHLNIVLEYAENGSLLSTLKAFGSLPEKLVGSFTHKILTGLNYLHAHDVVHRDLKAANILTTKTGEVKLTDFGVSFNLRLKQDEADILAGTPYWMAPEIIELEGASTKSDIWSLGCTIVELLTGKPPYANLISMSALYHIVEDDHPPLPTTLSKPLRDFLLACFQKDPTNRPTAKELLQHPWMIPLAKLHPPRPSPQSTKKYIPPLSHRSYTCPELDLKQQEDKDDLDMSTLFDYIKTNPVMDTQRAFIDTKSVSRHRFVKSNFETAIICRVCQMAVKRHAVCCIACAMICHDRCSPNATSCTLPSPQVDQPESAPKPAKPSKFLKIVANIKKNRSSTDLSIASFDQTHNAQARRVSTDHQTAAGLADHEGESRRWWDRFV